MLPDSAWAEFCITKCQKLGSLKENLFLTVLEAGSPKSRCWNGQVLSRPLFLAGRWSLSLGPHMAFPQCGQEENENKLSGVSCCKGTNPIMAAPPS